MRARGLTALALCAAMAGGAVAAPPTAAQKDDFYATCMGIAEDAVLCGCKAEAAMTLVDSGFMAIVVAAMKGRAPPADTYAAYNDYVARSNQICKPNY